MILNNDAFANMSMQNMGEQTSPRGYNNILDELN
jgi:hypothetical protein